MMMKEPEKHEAPMPELTVEDLAAALAEEFPS